MSLKSLPQVTIRQHPCESRSHPTGLVATSSEWPGLRSRPADIGGAKLRFQRPRKLFRRDTGGAQGGVANYDIAPNGETFVVVEDATSAVDGVPTPRLHIVLNFFEELKQRVPND